MIVGPDTVWRSWSFDPLVLAGLVAAAVLYRRGRRRRPVTASAGRAACFAAGLATVAVALVSPLDAAAAALFSAHMVQHLLLIVVAAPLLVMGRPARVMLAGLPARARRRVLVPRVVRATLPPARFLRRPAVTWALATVVVWGWHLPVLYTVAYEHDLVHALEHASFLLVSILVWSVAIEERSRHELGALGRALFLLANALQSGLLGALLLFAGGVLYPVHGAGPSAWGLTPLQDQQLAGALMWIPPAIFYVGASAVILFRWLRSMPADEPTRVAEAAT